MDEYVSIMFLLWKHDIPTNVSMAQKPRKKLVQLSRHDFLRLQLQISILQSLDPIPE